VMKTVGQLEREVIELRRLVKELIQPKNKAKVVNVGGSVGRWYKLIEDSHPTNGLLPRYAVRVKSPAGDDPESTPSLVVPWLLAPVKAGHVAWYVLDAGKWYFNQGDCPEECTSDGTLDVDSPATGTVGEAFTHSVSGTGLTGGGYTSVEFDGLPDGITADDEDLSGTPTTAGTYYVIVTATSPGTGDSEGDTCTLTRVLVITIEEAEEE